MEDRWSDPEFVLEWDRATSEDPHAGRKEQVSMLVDLLGDLLPKNGRLLDLGIGSGIIEGLLLERRPDVTVMGIDRSPAMLNVAAKRLRKGQAVHLIEHDLAQLDDVALPYQDADVVLSMMALHHLPQGDLSTLAGWVRRHLAQAGSFLVGDRTATRADLFGDAYGALWASWRRHEGERDPDASAYLEGVRHHEHQHGEGHADEGQPYTLDALLGALRQSGLEPAVLHLRINLAILIARMPSQPLT